MDKKVAAAVFSNHAARVRLHIAVSLLLAVGCSERDTPVKAGSGKPASQPSSNQTAVQNPTPPATNAVQAVTGVVLPHTFSDKDDLEVTLAKVRVTPAGGSNSWVMCDVYVTNKKGAGNQTVSWKPYIKGTAANGFVLDAPAAIAPNAGGTIEPSEQQKWQIGFKATPDDFPVTLTLLDKTTVTVSK